MKQKNNLINILVYSLFSILLRHPSRLFYVKKETFLSLNFNENLTLL